MPMVELRGLSALEAWTRKVTTGYKDVKVADLSTSWRDGLAFCALIHHFRPDLIDFDSLSKENILYNNRLAFQIAEKHLGVPSLLDAEDMFKHEEPDRLSVATYLSQFYECFEGPKSDRKHSITTTNSRKSVQNLSESLLTNNNCSTGAVEQSTGLTNRPIPPKRDMKCQKCKTRVYISDRILIDDNLYHKSCFESLAIVGTDSSQPAHTSGPTSNASSSIDNDSETEIKLSDIRLEDSCVAHTQSSVNGMNSIVDSIGAKTVDSMRIKTVDSNDVKTVVNIENNVNEVEIPDQSSGQLIAAISTDTNGRELVESTSIEQINCEISDELVSENSFVKQMPENSDLEPEVGLDVSQESDNKKITKVVDEVFEQVFGKSGSISEDQPKSNASKDKTTVEDQPKINGSNDKTMIEIKSKTKTKTKDIYPDDKNPFDDEEEESEDDNEMADKAVKNNSYPDDKNPFGDEEEDETEDNHKILIKIKGKTRRSSSDALNPFGSEDDNEEEDNNRNNSSNTTPKPRPRTTLNVSSGSPAPVSPTSSLRSRKKRVAPTPPSASTTTAHGLPQVNSSCSLSSSFVAQSEDNSRRCSLVSNASSDFATSVPTSRTPTPLPRVRLQKSSDDLSALADSRPKNEKCEQNVSKNGVKLDSELQSNDSESDLKSLTGSSSNLKLKKRPAPPIPAVRRIIKGSLAEIETELNQIGDQLPGIERKGLEFEQILMDRLKRNSTSEEPIVPPKDDKTMIEFMATARERCRLARRQKELMYMKREHKLEEIQADIEYQMRCVISKQAAQKTEEDHKQEEELLQRLMEIIEERNDIVENMIRDENKEVEEYQKLMSKVMPKPAVKPKPGGGPGVRTGSSKTSDSKADKSLKSSKSSDQNLSKLKDKLKLKELKELKEKRKQQKKLEKLEKAVKVDEKSEKPDNSLESKPKAKDSTKHLSLKSTLKPLKKHFGLKSSSDQKSDKKLDKKSNNSEEVLDLKSAEISEKLDKNSDKKTNNLSADELKSSSSTSISANNI